MADTTKTKGTSLAKGPVGIIGLILLAAGILGLLLGDSDFATKNAIDGTSNGDKFLGFEGNGWTWALTGVAGLLLLLAAPLHWGAKTMAIVVGLILGAASVIALYDEKDVFGLAAANGPTKLLWGAAAAALLISALLPRIGKKDHVDHDVDRAPRPRERVVERPVVERERHAVGERDEIRDNDRDRVDLDPRDLDRTGGAGERVVDRDVQRGVDRDLGDRDVVDRDRNVGERGLGGRDDPRGGAVSPDRTDR